MLSEYHGIKINVKIILFCISSYWGHFILALDLISLLQNTECQHFVCDIK